MKFGGIIIGMHLNGMVAHCLPFFYSDGCIKMYHNDGAKFYAVTKKKLKRAKVTLHEPRSHSSLEVLVNNETCHWKFPSSGVCMVLETTFSDMSLFYHNCNANQILSYIWKNVVD
jgi:hypothetical protein